MCVGGGVWGVWVFQEALRCPSVCVVVFITSTNAWRGGQRSQERSDRTSISVCREPYRGPVQRQVLVEAKNAKLGASDPSLNLYINMKWSKAKYLGSCIAF